MSGETGGSPAEQSGLTTGENHGRGVDGEAPRNPEDFASSESDLALSNQVAERKPGDEQADQ